MNVETILEKIHQGPRWRVLIQPTEFQKERISSLRDCKEIIEEARVMLRGWDYPHIDERTGGIRVRDGWVESGIDWDDGQYEVWRFYQSGQFAHQFSSVERFHALRRVPAPEHYILIHNTLFTLTEIFQFAANLARAKVLRPSGIVGIELAGIAGCELTSDDLSGAFFRGHLAVDDCIKREVQATEAEFVSRAADLALDQAVAIFERFNWLDVDRRFLATEQAKLLERRLGMAV